ncbi:MAG: hypothetical protein ACE5HS_01395 [bacterium]
MGKALLIIVTGFTTIVSGVLFHITSNQQLSAAKLSSLYNQWLIQNSKESASNAATSRLYQNLNYRVDSLYYNVGGVDCVVKITDIAVDSVREAKKILVRTVVNYADQSDTTFAIYQQPAYSYYYFFSKDWPLHIVYATGDTIMNRIHSNERFQITGTPVFMDKVTCKMGNYSDLGGADPKFLNSAEFGATAIALPNLTALKDTALAGGVTYPDELWLTFNADGSYKCSTNVITEIRNLADVGFNGTIMTTNKKNLHVKGVVNGQVTIISDEHLYIEDDLVYNSDPRIVANSTDFVGLICDKNIIVADNAETSAGVEIHAAILAKELVTVENYNIGAPRGTLTILGSIVQKSSLPFGTYDGFGTLLTGYNLVHVYDRRLFDRTPPYFPRYDRIELVYRMD